MFHLGGNSRKSHKLVAIMMEEQNRRRQHGFCIVAGAEGSITAGRVVSRGRRVSEFCDVSWLDCSGVDHQLRNEFLLKSTR